MTDLMVHLRYFLRDPLEDIRSEVLEEIGRVFEVTASFEKIDNREEIDGLLREETLHKNIEDMTQDIITLTSDSEDNLRKALIAIYDRYRSPRTPFAFWGSSPEGQRVAKKVVEETGGGW